MKIDKKSNCIFCNIISKELASNILYENNEFIIIEDIRPDAKVHILGIPKKHFKDLRDAELEDYETVNNIIKFVTYNSKNLGISNGFRIVMNNGTSAAQTVLHHHIHILGGQELKHMEKN